MLLPSQIVSALALRGAYGRSSLEAAAGNSYGMDSDECYNSIRPLSEERNERREVEEKTLH